jgi:hypothetical protein
MPYLVGYITPQDYGATGNGTTDDTAAIQAALNAASTNGSTVLFPAGSYLITSPLSVSVTGTVVAGVGWGSQILFDGNVAATALTSATGIRFHARDLRITQTNTSHFGTALDISNSTSGVYERLLIDHSGTGVSALTGIKIGGSGCFYNQVRDCRIFYGGTASTGIAISNGANSNVIDNCRFIPSGDVTGSSGIYITNTHSTTLIHPDIETGNGTGIWLDTAAHATTIINPYVEAMNIGLKITSGVIAPTVIGGTLQSAATANIQNNGAIQPNLQNLWPNSGSNTYNHLELGNADTFTVNGFPVLAGASQPSDQNLLSWSFDPALAVNGGVAFSTGIIHLIKVSLRFAATISNVVYNVTGAGSTLTSGQNFVGLYTTSGTRVALSADQTTTWGSSGVKTTAFTAPYSAAAGSYYIAFLTNGTTGPALARATGTANAGAMFNAGLTAASYRFATNSSALTALPATITLSSNGQETNAVWACLS